MPEPQRGAVLAHHAPDLLVEPLRLLGLDLERDVDPRPGAVAEMVHHALRDLPELAAHPRRVQLDRAEEAPLGPGLRRLRRGRAAGALRGGCRPASDRPPLAFRIGLELSPGHVRLHEHAYPTLT